MDGQDGQDKTSPGERAILCVGFILYILFIHVKKGLFFPVSFRVLSFFRVVPCSKMPN